MSIFATWTPASRCIGGPTKGAKSLMAWILDEYDEDGAYSLGIYACRDVRGGHDMSCHAEGRALDPGLPLVKAKDGTRTKPNPVGIEIVQRLRPVAGKLGIQAIIWNRVIWSAKSPGVNGRAYDGVDPHKTHLHIELTRAAGSALTIATIRHHVGVKAPEDKPKPTTPKPPTPVVPKPRQSGKIVFEKYHKDAKPSDQRLLKRGSAGDDVAWVQRMIGAKRAGPDDGRFGDKTTQGVRWYQAMRDIPVTGTVTPVTWRNLRS